jgi:hypothetical protein
MIRYHLSYPLYALWVAAAFRSVGPEWGDRMEGSYGLISSGHTYVQTTFLSAKFSSSVCYELL